MFAAAQLPEAIALAARCMLIRNLRKSVDARQFMSRPIIALTFLLALLTNACAYSTKQSVVGACPTTSGSGILNFCVVKPEVLWRGGKPDKDDAAWLMQHGVRTIVNLELLRDDKSTFAGARLGDAGNYQADYFRIHDWQPLSKWAPSMLDDHIAHFLALVGQQPKPIYVHCLFGLDRTGVMIAAYRLLVEGVDTEQAIEEMRRYHAPWFASNAKYLRALVPERRAKIQRQSLAWIPRLKRDARINCAGGSCAVTAGYDHPQR